MFGMELFIRFLNRGLSFVAFITAAALVVYMLVVFITGTLDVANLMLDTVLLEPDERQSIFNALNSDFLHNIAVLLVLMKAYRILVEYMRYHHIDIKYMVEIVIIASVLELLFNYTEFTPDMRLVLLGLAVSFLGIYAFRYDTLVQALKDTQAKVAQQNAAMPEPAVAPPKPAAKPRARKIAPKKRAVRKVAQK